jgi:hypothetical protein
VTFSSLCHLSKGGEEGRFASGFVGDRFILLVSKPLSGI